MTALHWAADGGHDEIAKPIFENVGNANANEILVLVRDSGGRMALHRLAFLGDAGHAEKAKLILENAGDAEKELLLVQDNDGRTALHDAAQRGHAEVVKLILEKAGDAEKELLLVQDNDGRTVLDTCIQNDFCGDRVHDAHIVPYFSEAGRLC